MWFRRDAPSLWSELFWSHWPVHCCCLLRRRPRSFVRSPLLFEQGHEHVPPQVCLGEYSQQASNQRRRLNALVFGIVTDYDNGMLAAVWFLLLPVVCSFVPIVSLPPSDF